MKNTKRLLAVVAVLILASAPSIAQFIDLNSGSTVPDVVWETVNRGTGVGIALVHVEGDLYAWVEFEDKDKSLSLTAGDTVLRVSYIRIVEL